MRLASIARSSQRKLQSSGCIYYEFIYITVFSDYTYLYTSYGLPYGEQTNLTAYNIIVHELRIFLYDLLL